MEDDSFNDNHIIESAYCPFEVKAFEHELTGKCPKCGRLVSEVSCDYCPRCGIKLDWKSANPAKWYRGLLSAEEEGTFVVQLTDQEYQGVLKFIEACQDTSYRCGDCDISVRGFNNPKDANDCKEFVGVKW